MKKLKLENLCVESFQTGASSAGEGTVRANQQTFNTECETDPSLYAVEITCRWSCLEPTACNGYTSIDC